jgi:acyl-CoA dehydrogenase
MTEPDVASSDATNISTRIERQGDEYVINGHKWWISGAADPRCKVFITMGKTDPEAPRHSQQSMIMVPGDTPGIRIVRPLNVFGYDDAPHGHVEMYFENVRVPAGNMLLGEGRGFEIAQGRLGPGRIHHCMRLIGLAERALELMCRAPRRAWPSARSVAQQTVAGAHRRGALQDRHGAPADAQGRVADGRAGNKVARTEIAMIKVVAPSMACQVIDWAMQVHGGGGVSDDFPLAYAYAGMPARCASPTARTRCTATPSPSGSWASTAATAAMPKPRSPAAAEAQASSDGNAPSAFSHALVKMAAACCSVGMWPALACMRR